MCIIIPNVSCPVFNFLRFSGALCWLDKYSTTDLHLQAHIILPKAAELCVRTLRGPPESQTGVPVRRSLPQGGSCRTKIPSCWRVHEDRRQEGHRHGDRLPRWLQRGQGLQGTEDQARASSAGWRSQRGRVPGTPAREDGLGGEVWEWVSRRPPRRGPTQ